MEDIFPPVIGEANPGIADLFGQMRQDHSPGDFLDFGFPVHEVEDPDGRGQTFLGRVLHRAEALDGLVKHQQRG